MSERWKPNNRKEYFYVNISCADPKSDTWLNTDLDENRWKNGNCFKTKEEAEYAAIKVKDLLLRLQPEVAKLPKLTAEVFDRPDCQEWAKYAAVDKDGTARFHAEEPTLPTVLDGEWWCSTGNDTFITGEFDASDWQNSLIERPKKSVNWDEVEEILCNSTLTFKEIKQELPDWCKVGERVWSDGDYYEVIETGADWFRTSRNGDTGLWGANILPQFSQARLRPYNAEEMRGLVGKVISHQLDAYLCVGFHRGNETVDYGPYRHTEQDLLKTGATIDGKPCGVLEHFVDGEWVK